MQWDDLFVGPREDEDEVEFRMVRQLLRRGERKVMAQFCSDGLSMLARELDSGKHVNLSSLELSKCCCTLASAALEFGRMLERNSCLTKLVLNEWDAPDDNMVLILQGMHHLQSLLISGFSFVGLGAVISPNAGSLLELHLEGANWKEEILCDLVDVIVEKQRLRELYLVNVGLSENVLRKLCGGRNQSIKTLVLDNNQTLGNGGGRVLKELLQTDTLLERLSVRYFSLGATGVTDVMEGLERNSSLRHLDVSYNDMDPSSVATVISKKSTLQSVFFCSSPLEDDVKDLIAKNWSLEEGDWCFRQVFERNRALLQRVRKASRELLMIRWFRESSLSVLPKDIVRLIAKLVWTYRFDWIG